MGLILFSCAWGIYRTNLFFKSQLADSFNRRIDKIVSRFFLNNWFHYQDKYFSKHPGILNWKPARIIRLNEREQYFLGYKYVFFGQVQQWNASNNFLLIETYNGPIVKLEFKPEKGLKIIKQYLNAGFSKPLSTADDNQTFLSKADLFCVNDVLGLYFNQLSRDILTDNQVIEPEAVSIVVRGCL